MQIAYTEKAAYIAAREQLQFTDTAGVVSPCGKYFAAIFKNGDEYGYRLYGESSFALDVSTFKKAHNAVFQAFDAITQLSKSSFVFVEGALDGAY